MSCNGFCSVMRQSKRFQAQCPQVFPEGNRTFLSVWLCWAVQSWAAPWQKFREWRQTAKGLLVSVWEGRGGCDRWEGGTAQGWVSRAEMKNFGREPRELFLFQAAGWKQERWRGLDTRRGRSWVWSEGMEAAAAVGAPSTAPGGCTAGLALLSSGTEASLPCLAFPWSKQLPASGRSFTAHFPAAAAPGCHWAVARHRLWSVLAFPVGCPGIVPAGQTPSQGIPGLACPAAVTAHLETIMNLLSSSGCSNHWIIFPSSCFHPYAAKCHLADPSVLKPCIPSPFHVFLNNFPLHKTLAVHSTLSGTKLDTFMSSRLKSACFPCLHQDTLFSRALVISAGKCPQNNVQSKHFWGLI